MRIKLLTAKIIIAGIPAVFPALAQAVAEAPGTEAPDLFSAGVKMAGAMLLIVAVLLILLYLFKRAGSSRNGLLGGPEVIRVLATRHLAPKNFITLVEIGDSVLTLGVTSENITTLDKVSSAAFHQNTGLKTGEPDRTSFAYRLKTLTGQGFALAKMPSKQ